MSHEMCITKNTIYVEKGPGHEEIMVPCGQCWQCRANRVNDYEGRALCEAAMSRHTVTLTLTYAPRSDGADKILTPKHFQNSIRALRKRGHCLRYLVCGEYGELKGRAHFHAVLFFKNDPPEMPQKTNFHADWWPHGHIFADHNIDPRTLRYVMKYILKEEYGKHWFSLSKKPALGAEWFKEKARRNVDAGVMPSRFVYHPPGGWKGREYLMSKTTRRDYLAEILAGYAAQGTEINPDRISDYIRNQFDQNRLSEHEAAFYALPPEEICEIILSEIKKKAPTLRQVQKNIMDTDPEMDLLLDWNAIRSRWNNGKEAQKRQSDTSPDGSSTCRRWSRKAKFQSQAEKSEPGSTSGVG